MSETKTSWLKIDRKIFDHWLWDNKPKSKFEAWVWILSRANFKDTTIMLGNTVVDVDRGSFITSEVKLMDKFKWSKSKLRAFLKMLESDSMIIKKTDSKKTTIEVVNYGMYQDSQTAKRPEKNCKKTQIRRKRT